MKKPTDRWMIWEIGIDRENSMRIRHKLLQFTMTDKRRPIVRWLLSRIRVAWREMVWKERIYSSMRRMMLLHALLLTRWTKLSWKIVQATKRGSLA